MRRFDEGGTPPWYSRFLYGARMKVISIVTSIHCCVQPTEFCFSVYLNLCTRNDEPKRETIKLSNPPTMVIFQHSMSLKGGHFECHTSEEEKKLGEGI